MTQLFRECHHVRTPFYRVRRIGQARQTLRRFSALSPRYRALGEENQGKLHYFGPWADPDGALKKYLEQKDALHAGRTPRPDPAALTIKDLANAFLNHKHDLLDAGELSPRTWAQYKEMCDLLVEQLGKGRLVEDLGPDDFANLRRQFARRWGPVTLGNVIQRVRVVFKHAADNDLIDRPLRYGQGFKRPSKKTFRLEKARQRPKLFSREEIHRLLQAASVPLKAMMLLGINCGLGNADCGRLPVRALDMERGWLYYPRPKTGMERRCPLWPETVEALNEALARRPQHKDPVNAGLVFITRFGQAWHTDTSESPVSYEVGKLLRKLGINGRQGLGFYTLRHTFRTVADESKDQPAVDFIMGHEVPHMSAVYRETISDARLKAVADYVRVWLLAAPSAMASPSSGGEQGDNDKAPTPPQV
jgi:integrase